jgi:hypothetical protein
MMIPAPTEVSTALQHYELASGICESPSVHRVRLIDCKLLSCCQPFATLVVVRSLHIRTNERSYAIHSLSMGTPRMPDPRLWALKDGVEGQDEIHSICSRNGAR